MRELAHLVASEFHLRAFIVGLGILLGFNYGVQYKPSVVSFIAAIGSSGPTLSLPATPLNHITPIQAEYFFPSRSVSASFRTTPTSTTILSSPVTSTLQWSVPSQTNWNPPTDPNSISGLSELSSVPVSKSSFSAPACNSTLSSSKGRHLCLSPQQEAIKPYFEALTRVIVAKRSPQNAPRPKGDVKERLTDLILHPSYATSASQEKVAAEFSLIEILVLPALLAIVIRLAVYIAFIVVSTVLDLVISSVALCAYSTRVCRAILVFLNFPRVTRLESTRRQGRLRARHRKKGILPPNITSASLCPLPVIRTFLYAPEQRIKLEHIILRDENAATSIPSSKDLYDPRYLVIVKGLGNSGCGRVCIVKNFKKPDEANAEEGRLVLKSVSRYVGGYRLPQFAQELRALDRLQESRWCPKLVASFAGPEDLHMLMVRFGPSYLSRCQFLIMVQTYYPRGHLADFIGEAGGHLSRAQAKYYLVELVGFQHSIYILIITVLTISSLLPFALSIKWPSSIVESLSRISSLQVADTSSSPTSAKPRSTTTPTVQLRMRFPRPLYRKTASGITMR